MNTILDEARRAAPVADTTADTTAGSPLAPRLDLYLPIHKALRLFMVDTLAKVGRLDVDDAGEMQCTLGQLDALLTACRAHVQHENDHVHPAIEARHPCGTSRTAADHLEHVHAIADLRDECATLRAAAGAIRSTLALRLYRHLSLFIAENLQHMHVEETANNAALWAHYGDDELHALHGRILGSLTDAEHLEVARWMIPALNPTERAMVLGGMQAAMPPEAFRVVLDTVTPHLDAAGHAKLCRALGIAIAPGLMTA